MVNRKLAVILCAAALAQTTFCRAGTLKDLGTFGMVYGITEPSLVDELRAGAPRIDIEKEKKEQARYQPADLRKLPRATTNRSFTVDMTYTLPHALKDAKGHVLYPAGFTYNPLRYMGFVPGIVVIDGSDPRQVEWFEKSPYVANKLAMLLISDGYAFDLTRKLKRPVYYLTGIIADRFRLAAVPSIVVRKGDKVSVTEVKIEN